MIDLWQGYRNKFIKCEYWSKVKDPDIAKFSQLAYEKLPAGYFKASIVGNYSEETQTLENAFSYQKQTVMVETKDDVKILQRDDLVRMKGKMYRVVDINRTPITKQEQYLNDPISYTTYISLRG